MIRSLGVFTHHGEVAELPKVKRASPVGRAMVALVKRLEGLAPPTTGLYLALGPEKVAMNRAFFELVAAEGFDAAGTTAPLLHHTPYGPLTSVALELGCRGPFAVVEAGADAGLQAGIRALSDLERGRCTHAVIAGWNVAGEVVVVGLGRDASAATWASGLARTGDEVRATLSQKSGRPLHGVGGFEGLHHLVRFGNALEAAVRGTPSVVHAPTDFGRELGVAFWCAR